MILSNHSKYQSKLPIIAALYPSCFPRFPGTRHASSGGERNPHRLPSVWVCEVSSRARDSSIVVTAWHYLRHPCALASSVRTGDCHACVRFSSASCPGGLQSTGLSVDKAEVVKSRWRGLNRDLGDHARRGRHASPDEDVTRRRDPAGPGQVYRLRSLVVTAWVCIIGMPAVLFGGVIYISVGSPTARDLVVAALGSLFGGTVMWFLYLRPRLVVSEDGVTVVNYGRPHFFPWAEVIGFDVRLRLQARTRGRGRVEVQALPAGGIRRLFGRPTVTDRLARRLNEDHRGRFVFTGDPAG